jgi:hypothetical protein
MQVHAPELIKRFQKTRSSHQNNATINYQAALGILSRPKALTPPWDYSSLTEAEFSESTGVTDKGFYIWKKNPGYTYCADGKLRAEFILRK